MATEPPSSEKLTKSELDKQKRRAQRIALMKKGMEDLEAWLADLIREGIASTEGHNYAFWQDFSARMVDTQLTALGPRIRSLQLLPQAQNNWPAQMLEELAELFLLARGFRRLDELPQGLQEQLLRIAGIRDSKKELLQQSGLIDRWGVIGQFEGINIDNGHFRRIWLRGAKSRKLALLLDYDYQNRGYDSEWELGGIYSGEIIYYPATYPQRALLKNAQLESNVVRQLKGYENSEAFWETYSQALIANPWLPEFACCFEALTPVLENEKLFFIDSHNAKIPTHTKEAITWQLIALSGGKPITVFGEWTGDLFIPLSVVSDGRFVALRS